MKLLVFLGSLSLASAVCNYGTSHNPRVQRRAEATFGYSDLTGPLDWHGLAAENSACALGISQSPIDINPAELTTVSGFNLAFNVASNIEGAEIENLGTTLEVFVNGTIQLGYKAYELAQFHIHTPSEHHILGEYYPAETHFVFEAAGMLHPSVTQPYSIPNISHDLKHSSLTCSQYRCFNRCCRLRYRSRRGCRRPFPSLEQRLPKRRRDHRAGVHGVDGGAEL